MSDCTRYRKEEIKYLSEAYFFSEPGSVFLHVDRSTLSRDFEEFSLMEEEDSTTHLPADNCGCNFNSRCVPSAKGKVVFQLNTFLNRQMVRVDKV